MRRIATIRGYGDFVVFFREELSLIRNQVQILMEGIPIMGVVLLLVSQWDDSGDTSDIA